MRMEMLRGARNSTVLTHRARRVPDSRTALGAPVPEEVNGLPSLGEESTAAWTAELSEVVAGREKGD